MNLYEKLLDIQTRTQAIIKDMTVGEGKQAYKAVSSVQVVEQIRPMMDEHKLLLIPNVVDARVIEGKTSSGTSRYFTEMFFNMVWHDVESGEELAVPSYAQGVDLAGEKGVGKAHTYNEKYFLMKFFHIPTPADDPDQDNRTKSGEKAQRGTQAAKENTLKYRAAVPLMLHEMYVGDTEKIKAAYVALTKADNRGYAGVDNIAAVSDAALPVLYGKVKKNYEKRTGKTFEMEGLD